MLADGTICACPYTYKVVGNIFHLEEIDWNKNNIYIIRFDVIE